MHPKIGELINQCNELKMFLRGELKREISDSEKRTLTKSLRKLKKCEKDLRKLQKTLEIDANIVYRVHRRRSLNLLEFERDVEEQKKKVDRIEMMIMAGYVFNPVNN